MSEDLNKKIKGKHILIGISAGISAYKSLILIRYFKKLGAEVKVIMTPASNDFITKLSVSTLSQNTAYCELIDETSGNWVNHVELALWADVFVIAPLTANTLAKMASGIADNLLLVTYLSAKSPVIVAPAMDLDMYRQPSTKRNINQLKEDGIIVLEAESGFLASGLHGQGRMQEPETIGDFVVDFLTINNRLENTTVLITAGPTYERIDPVRFIGNLSSGKMGFELAKCFLQNGAKVHLVAGPNHQELLHPNLTLHKVFSADEMFTCVKENWENCQIGVFAAAVADFKPKDFSNTKIKKEDADVYSLELIRNPDILKWAGEHKTSTQFLMGFALETNDALEHGKSKLEKKHLDAVVINSLEDRGAGFEYDTNKINIVGIDNKISKFELKQKSEVANDIVEYILNKYEI